MVTKTIQITEVTLDELADKVGNAIGGNWKGIDYLRIKPSSVKNPRTEGQVNQCNRFSITLNYLQPNLGFIKLGYNSFATKKTEFNAEISDVLNNVVSGTDLNFTIDYSLALFCRGTLSGVLN